MKKFIASLIIVAAGNSCIAMNRNSLSDKDNVVITYRGTIKIPPKENIKLNLQFAGLDFFCEKSKIDEKLADQSLPPVTIVAYVNEYLKDLGYGDDSSIQPKIIKIIIDNDAVYNRLVKTGWITVNSSNMYT